MSYWAFYRIWPNGLGADNSSLLSYMYVCCFNDYFYTTHSNGDDFYYCSNPGVDSCMLSYTVDSDGKCNYTINPGRVDHGLNGIEHGATVLGQFYNYYNNVNGRFGIYPENIPLTLNGLTEGTDYICKKYSYGTEEYNELMSYLIGTSFDHSGTTGATPNITLQVKLSQGDDVESTGFNSFIKNFSNERFMPDIFVVQNYAENYIPADVPSCNIWCYGVVQGYTGAPSDDWATTCTITIESFGDLNASELNLSSSNYLYLYTPGEGIAIDGIGSIGKKTTFTLSANSSVDIHLNANMISSNIMYNSSELALKVRIDFGPNTTISMNESGNDYEVGNTSWYVSDTDINNFDMEDTMLYLESEYYLTEDNPSGSPYYVNATFANNPYKQFTWTDLGNSNLSGIVYHNITEYADGGGASIEGCFILGVKNIDGKYYLIDTNSNEINDMNGWEVYIKSTDPMNTGAIIFPGMYIG